MIPGKFVIMVVDNSNPKAMDVGDLVVDCLRKSGIDVAGKDDEIEKALFIIAIGGDGTILKAANLEAQRQLNCIAKSEIPGKTKPILGINCGRRGFLASVHYDQDWLAAIDRAIAGNYFAKRRTRLSLRVDRQERRVCEANALNEFHFGRIDEYVVNPLILVGDSAEGLILSRGDGLILSTATGSTAYCSSAFGQVTNRQDRFVVTVICPTDREKGYSELIDANKICRFIVSDRERMHIEADGKRVFALESGDLVTIKKSVIASYIMEFGDEIT